MRSRRWTGSSTTVVGRRSSTVGGVLRTAMREALKDPLGGTAELDTGDSSADAASLDCTWRNTATGVGAIRIQVPRNTNSAFIDLVASQEATGTKEYQIVPGFDEARRYGTKSFIAQNGGLAAWIWALT